MIKKIVIAIILIILGIYLNDLYNDYAVYQKMLNEVPKAISLEAASIKVNVDDNTAWETVAKAVSSILATFLGIKVINKIL